jgi:hypothetical protein
MQFSHEKDAQRGSGGRESSQTVKRVAAVVVRGRTSGHAVPWRAIELMRLCSVYALLSWGPDVTGGAVAGRDGEKAAARVRKVDERGST